MPLTDNTIDFAAETAGTYYVRLRDDTPAARKTWKNTVTVGWQTYNSANWTTYAVALSAETDPLHYSVAMPAGITAAIERLTIEIYKQAGGSPATSDDRVAVAEAVWNGTAFVGAVSSADVATAVMASTAADGVALSDQITNIRAATGGLVTSTENEDGTLTIAFKKLDGTTPAFSIIYDPTTGDRTAVP